jgi:hypothetical protein
MSAPRRRFDLINNTIWAAVEGKVLLTVSEFLSRYSVGRSRFYKQVRIGRLRRLKIGRKTLIAADEAERWRKALPQHEVRDAACQSSDAGECAATPLQLTIKRGRGRPRKTPLGPQLRGSDVRAGAGR